MRRRPIGFLLLGLASIVAVGAALVLLSRAGRRSLLDALPVETRLLVHAPDAGRLWKVVVPVLTSAGPDGSAVAADLARRLLDRAGFGGGPAEDCAVWQARAEAALALVQEDGRSPDLVLLASPAGDAGDALDRARLCLTPRSRAGDRHVRSHSGTSYEVVRGPQGRALCLAASRGLLVVASSAAAMRRVLDTIAGRRRRLSSDASYRSAVRALPRRRDLVVFASAQWLRETTAPLSNSIRRTERAPQRIGLRAIGAFASSISVRGRLLHETFSVPLSSAARLLAGDLLGGRLRRPRLPRAVPAEFPFVLDLSIGNPRAARLSLARFLDGAAPAGGPDDPTSRLAGLEALLAIDARREILAPIGDRLDVGFGHAAGLPRGAPNRQLLNMPAVASLRVRDHRAAARVLRRLDGLARAIGAYRRIEADDRALTVYDVPALAPLAPSYLLESDRLVAATSSALLERALEADRLRTSAADRPDRARAVRALPDTISMLFCGDTALLVDAVGVTAKRPAAFLVPEPIVALLRGAASRPGLPPSVAGCRLTGTGVVGHWVGPISATLLAWVWIEGSLDPGPGGWVDPGGGSLEEEPDA